MNTQCRLNFQSAGILGMILNFRLGSIVYKLYQSTFLPTPPHPFPSDQLSLTSCPLLSPHHPQPLQWARGRVPLYRPFYGEKVTALPWQWGANPGVGAPPVRFRGLLQRPSGLLCVQRFPAAGALRGISLQLSNLALFPFYPASGHSFWGHTGASGRHAPYSSPPPSVQGWRVGVRSVGPREHGGLGGFQPAVGS